MATTGVDAPGRAQIGVRTLRKDRYWVQPAITAAVLIFFVIYSAWRVFSGVSYYAAPYLSVYYSPCIAANCVPGSETTPLVGSWWALSPALLTAWVPLAYRMTCYYYRKAYYRSFWFSPPACAVAEPHSKYTGEKRFPLILNNSHRYFLYLAVVFNLVLTYDALLAFRNPQGQWGHMGFGTVLLLVNAAALWIYTLSCHSCRSAVGGRLNHFSKHPIRYKLWTWVSKLNGHHPRWAWISLFTVMLADFYVYLLASGHLTDWRFF